MKCPKCHQSMKLLETKFLGNTQYLMYKCTPCGETLEDRV